MTRSSPPTTFGVRYSPACLLCGIVILDNSDLERAGLKVLLKQDQWKFPGSKGRSKHIMASATEIENKEFIMNPELSSCYFRAVIKSPSSPKYYLTGIGPQAMSKQPRDQSGARQAPLHYLPRDVSTARICGSTAVIPEGQLDDNQFIQFFPAELSRQRNDNNGNPVGHIFHYHCWEILRHLIGKESLSKPSIYTKIVQAARGYWKNEHSLWRLSYYDLLKHPYCYEYRDWSMDERRTLFLNPWIIPEVQREIQFAREISGNRKSRYFDRIPLEILLMIMQFVFPLECTSLDVESTKNMLLVFELNLPDSFWKARLSLVGKEHLFFESHVLKETDANSVDWRILQLGWMGLLVDDRFQTSALRSRETIYGRIKRIIDTAEVIHKKPLSKCVRYKCR